MASLNPDLDIALTQLTERLLTQEQTCIAPSCTYAPSLPASFPLIFNPLLKEPCHGHQN